MKITNCYSFSTTGVISNAEDLEGWYGEHKLLSILIDHIRQSGSFFLYGERFSGKTSILKCLQHQLMLKDNQWIPVYININANLSGSTESLNSHRFILSTIYRDLQNLATDNTLWSADDLNQIIQPFPLLDDPELVLGNALYNIDRLMKKYNKSLLLMFDDAEKMPRYFQGNEDSFFYPFRELKNNWQSGKGGITCALASAEKISFFEHHTGSPQFNNIGYEIPVPPLSHDDFTNLWTKLLSVCSPDDQRNLLEHVQDFKTAYDLCGGRPAFAKEIFNIWRKSVHGNDKNPLRNKLRNIYDRQPEDAKKYLVDLACGRLPDDDFCTERLVDLYLIEKNEPEIGGYRIRGRLWRNFLRNLDDSSANFANAGILARHIISNNYIYNLLKLRHGKGELDDWLEFKGCLIPTEDQFNKDSITTEINSKSKNGTKTVRQKSKNDYIWHVLHSLIAMRNTRGGLLLLGIDDTGEIIGMEGFKDNEGEIDFLRKIKNHLGHTKYKCGNIVREIKSSNWNMDDASWITFKIHIIDGKKIVSITIIPVQMSDRPDFVRVVEYEQDKPNYVKKYVLLRSKNASVYQAIQDNIEFDQVIDSHKEVCFQTDDLTEFWRNLQI